MGVHQTVLSGVFVPVEEQAKIMVVSSLQKVDSTVLLDQLSQIFQETFRQLNCGASNNRGMQQEQEQGKGKRVCWLHFVEFSPCEICGRGAPTETFLKWEPTPSQRKLIKRYYLEREKEYETLKPTLKKAYNDAQNSARAGAA
eukprot:CAMPEP_0118701282 /NCGR_PEP_ID=MMETSP0800-20121206/17150_1 /TAXON_ID=210618 ORGANISM="Striatella unipunctata, Strain CCMP2910" /NCGR_SAMPLE_ID=MMETSP0800 /ASSEMBLY_ACC=CAM_ASM_000638 /LENGTH=142 /DNA_ID=CAMNT_0006602157 /DNA_START=127 /DNA_END=555 /DNA_ORIENTATION=+